MRSPSLVAVLLVLGLAACGRSDIADPDPHPPGVACQAIMGTPRLRFTAAWPVGTCLDITFSAGAEQHARRLRDALLTWVASSPGTWLCFNPVKPGEAVAARTVHVRVGETLSPSAVAETTLTYSQETKTVLTAEVVYSPEFPDPGATSYLHCAGQVLGFARTDGVDSVLNLSTLDDEPRPLSAADRQSTLAIYPACR
ncbi:MAG: hypothetical protein IPJ65_03045 [Archangiaceae bacterium]|nr:hypothetical protein [Archangiaceae bacterium]